MLYIYPMFSCTYYILHIYPICKYVQFTTCTHILCAYYMLYIYVCAGHDDVADLPYRRYPGQHDFREYLSG